MNEDLGLRVLGKIMSWDDDCARKEFAWLRLMARLKYDSYQDFQAGMRFTESLATWLQQFQPDEREAAYDFVRRTLVYIGPAEMNHLVEQFYPGIVRQHLTRKVAMQRGIPPYLVLAKAADSIERLRRQTLLVGLSEGARLDTIRHTNTGLLSNEQFLQSTQVDTEKWKELLTDLRSDLDDTSVHFRLVYLIDDFVGTGTSLLRFDEENRKWKGKLIRFMHSARTANNSLDGDSLFAKDCEFCVHHHVASSAAVETITSRMENAMNAPEFEWPGTPHPSFGMILPRDFPINSGVGTNDNFIQLTNSHYDPSIRTRHTDVGGVTHLGLGYGGCALPLVLGHNTPNNAVALLWAETDGGIADGENIPAMRPLFRRRQRHV